MTDGSVVDRSRISCASSLELGARGGSQAGAQAAIMPAAMLPMVCWPAVARLSYRENDTPAGHVIRRYPMDAQGRGRAGSRWRVRDAAGGKGRAEHP